LLTNQLESQRLFFEQKIGFIEKEAVERVNKFPQTAFILSEKIITRGLFLNFELLFQADE